MGDGSVVARRARGLRGVAGLGLGGVHGRGCPTGSRAVGQRRPGVPGFREHVGRRLVPHHFPGGVSVPGAPGLAGHGVRERVGVLPRVPAARARHRRTDRDRVGRHGRHGVPRGRFRCGPGVLPTGVPSTRDGRAPHSRGRLTPGTVGRGGVRVQPRGTRAADPVRRGAEHAVLAERHVVRRAGPARVGHRVRGGAGTDPTHRRGPGRGAGGVVVVAQRGGRARATSGVVPVPGPLARGGADRVCCRPRVAGHLVGRHAGAHGLHRDGGRLAREPARDPRVAVVPRGH